MQGGFVFSHSARHRQPTVRGETRAPIWGFLLLAVLSGCVSSTPGTLTPLATAKPAPTRDPSPTRTPTSTPTETMYLVQPGDTLARIAELFGTTAGAICD